MSPRLESAHVAYQEWNVFTILCEGLLYRARSGVMVVDAWRRGSAPRHALANVGTQMATSAKA